MANMNWAEIIESSVKTSCIDLTWDWLISPQRYSCLIWPLDGAVVCFFQPLFLTLLSAFLLHSAGNMEPNISFQITREIESQREVQEAAERQRELHDVQP